MKNPKAWLATIWLMEKGLSISANALAAVLNIAQSSAHYMLKKIRMVLIDNMGQSSASFDCKLFEDLFCKRSRETPARAHPVAELDDLDKLSASQADKNADESAANIPAEKVELFACEPLSNEGSQSQQLDLDLDANQNLVFSLLSPEPISFDALLRSTGLSVPDFSSALGMLDLAGLVKPLPGNMFVRVNRVSDCFLPQKLALSMEDRAHIAGAVKLIKETLHGCSRKAAQFYLADYWRTSCKMVWGENKLLQACLRTGQIKEKEIVAYVTPPLVLLLPLKPTAE
ncbi:MAG: hypothetical protein ACREBW_05340 [Candidatus Micrarchaeaceae archaeon]